MALKIITTFLFTFSLTLLHGQGWSKYYIKQLYINDNDTLYYGLSSLPDDSIIEYPLMVWLTNNSSTSRDTLPLIWMKYFNTGKSLTINPYLKKGERWDILNNASLKKTQLKNLINIFIDREDITDSQTIVCGYNEAGIMAEMLKKDLGAKIKLVIAFIDNKNLIKNCIASPNIIYVMPKKFKTLTRKIRFNCLYINHITKDDIIKLNNEKKIFR